ncbi:MAG TPA: DUF58 domain-containing protein [Acidiphilium sp.]
MADAPSGGLIVAAEALAAALPSLLLAAQRLAASAAPGRHGRRRAGGGEQFWQYRDVRDGDPLRTIDWRRSARGDRLYVREREREAVETLVLDISDYPGMHWRSAQGGETKWQRAVLLGLAVASLAFEGGERVALCGRAPPPAGQGALERLAAGLALPKTEARPLGRFALFGDFLDEPDRIAADLASLGAGSRGGVLVQILDPAECDFPYRGRVLFEDVAGGAPEDIARAGDIAEAYRARLAAQREAVAAVARAARLVPLFHRTDRPPGPALAAIRAALEPAA